MDTRSSRVFDVLFFILTFLFISDLNGSLSIMFQTRAILSEVILVLTIILFFRSLQMKNSIPGISNYYIFFYVFFLVFGSILFYVSHTKIGYPYERIRSLTPSIIIFYTYSKWFVYYFSHNKLDYIINIIAISLFANTIAIIYSYFSGSIFSLADNADLDRSRGLISGVNQAGTVAVITQVFILYIASKHGINKLRKMLLLLFYFISLYAAIVTFSKAAMLKSLVVLFVFIYYFFIKDYYNFNWRAKQSRNNLFGLFVLIFLAIFFGFGQSIISSFSDYQYSRLVDFKLFLQGNINDEITTNRSSLALYAINLIKEDNFMGRGLDTFHRMEGVGIGPHNQFLLFLGEIGIIGLIMYLIYLIGLFFKLLNLKVHEVKFLGLSIFFILLITASSMHTMLFNKTIVIMFSLLGVLASLRPSIMVRKIL